VLNAAVTVLADWAKGPGGWASGAPDATGRPVGVVTVGSRSRPQLVHSLGARLAEVGRMPLLGAVSADGAPEGRSNSAQRLRALHSSLALPAEVIEAVESAKGPVLLVDDFTDSGWTLAVAGRLLLRAGATEVLPLVLAVQS
jgi:ATP-dependent DNA helicase RecQ